MRLRSLRPTVLLALAACAARPGGAPARTAGPGAGESEVAAALAATPRELTADQQVRHALDRLAFGPRPGDVAAVRALGVDRWIARQLAPAQVDDADTERLLAALGTTTATPAELATRHPLPQRLQRRAAMRARDAEAPTDSAELARAVREARQSGRRVVEEAQTARVLRAVASERQLLEVMTDFWHNHFSVFAGKAPPMRHYLASYDRDVIRAHALGRFRDLLGAVAHAPAMLLYLDNAQSVADSGAPRLDARGRTRAAPPRALAAPGGRRRGLNENYARELLELHTLGVDGGYSQRDVVEVARAFTGWTVRQPAAGGGFAFVPPLHDAGAKTVLGHALPAGRGIEDGEAVLDLLARHPATARHVATKLAIRFVSDSPSAALVERVAAEFLRTDGDLRATMRALVASPEFWAREAWRAKVKSPFEVVVSTARALGASPDTTPRTARAIAMLGQPVFGRQSPDGWPERGAEWMNAGAIVNRINFGLRVAAGRLPGATPLEWPGAREARALPRERQVDLVIAHFLAGAASPETRQVLLAGENPLGGADGDGTSTAEGASRGAPRPAGLAQVVGLALGAPEFQRR